MSAEVSFFPATDNDWKQARCRFFVICFAIFGSFGGHQSAVAFDSLTSAQKLVYDTPHLSNTVAGQRISYRYSSQFGDADKVSDRVLLSVNQSHEDDKRDVVLDFLTADRHMNLPDFTGYRGNPIIIAMLEHIAQGFGQETGGGVLYFRNRIRDALANPNSRIEQVTVNLGDRSVAATRLYFSPFIGDKYLADNPLFTNAAFSIVLSDRVPGGVIAVGVRSSQNALTSFEREIVIE